MNQASFEWDKYLATAKYAEVMRNSPDLSSRRPPALYSPDRAWIYLSSLDLDFETNDINGLKNILKDLAASYTHAKLNNDHKKFCILKLTTLKSVGFCSR